MLPHLIDHAANLRPCSSRAATGCWASARSARSNASSAVGTLLCPDDFIALHLGVSIFADTRAHRRRASTPAGAREVLDGLGRGRRDEPRDGGVYWQAIGPASRPRPRSG